MQVGGLISSDGGCLCGICGWDERTGEEPTTEDFAIVEAMDDSVQNARSSGSGMASGTGTGSGNANGTMMMVGAVPLALGSADDCGDGDGVALSRSGTPPSTGGTIGGVGRDCWPSGRLSPSVR